MHDHLLSCVGQTYLEHGVTGGKPIIHKCKESSLASGVYQALNLDVNTIVYMFPQDDGSVHD